MMKHHQDRPLEIFQLCENAKDRRLQSGFEEIGAAGTAAGSKPLFGGHG